jgi:hypothetical protein
MQAAFPFGSVGQAAQLAPHALASLSAAHWPPQRWYPGPHVKSQAVPLHVVTLAPVGLGHAEQAEVPQVSVLLLLAQIPAHSWVPAGQAPAQAALASMHAPAQLCFPVGQLGTQAVPSQVTAPPAGSWQAVHEVAPQLPTFVLFTQRPPHRWYPAWHVIPQAPPTH